METLNASKNCRFTESRSLTRAHKTSRSLVNIRRIDVKFAAICPTRLINEKYGAFSHIIHSHI